MNKSALLLIALLLTAAGCAPAAGPTAAPPPGPPTAAPASPTLTKETETMTVAPTLTAASTPALAVTTAPAAASIEDVIAFEMKGSFNFFWEQANTDPGSPGYGLIRDRYPGSPGVASIASVGYGLTAIPIGIEQGYISYDQGAERVSGTLDTLLRMDRVEGFYYHFVDMKTTQRVWNCEVSNIDTSILLMGVLFAGQYFGGNIQAKAQAIYDGVNWPWYLDTSVDEFWMGYHPEKGFEGHWDFYAEQLMMYVLAAGSDTHPTDDTPYYTFTRHWTKYRQGKQFVNSWYGSIFTYQFSHAWIDFRGRTDRKKTNWFDNSVEASKAQVAFATANADKYETIGPDAWGLTASDGPKGYEGRYGAPPSGFDNTMHYIDDTVAPSGAIGSIIFTPDDSKRAMLHYDTFDRLKGEYGFKDAFNLARNWYATDVIGIDKGISLLMLANYQDDFVHRVMMKNENILKGLDVLRISTPNQ